MNYEESIAYIDSLSPTLVRPGLERFDLFMQEQRNLQDSYASLHIAGTNGKGSVVCMLAETFRQAGIKCGRYTGPHLLAYNERVEIDAAPISDDEFAAICSELRNKSEEFGKRHPEHGILTWFELLTAISFFEFAKTNVEVGVFEVGLGGQFDATTVLHSPVSTAIVSISLDHTHILGSTVEEIAREKAGIIKAGVPLVTACQGSALGVILEQARINNAPVIRVNEHLELQSGANLEEEEKLISALQARFESLQFTHSLAAESAEAAQSLRNLISNRKGYQRHNAAVAAVVLGLWELKHGKDALSHFDKALNTFFWPGRMQFFEAANLLLDGAHNEAGAAALRQSLDELFPNKARAFILSFYQTKHFEKILSALIQPGDKVYASQASGKRPVVSAAKIVEKATEIGASATEYESIESAFKAAVQDAPRLLKIGAGSFATVAAGLKYLGFESVREAQCQSKNI